MRKNSKTSGPRSGSSTPPPPGKHDYPEVACRQVLVDLARKMQSRLMSDEEAKVTFSEYFKILQLLKETEGDLPADITVRWADPIWSKWDRPSGLLAGRPATPVPPVPGV